MSLIVRFTASQPLQIDYLQPRLRRMRFAGGRACERGPQAQYVRMMFFPKPNFVATVSRTVLRLPFSMSGKKLKRARSAATRRPKLGWISQVAPPPKPQKIALSADASFPFIRPLTRVAATGFGAVWT